MNNVKLHRNIKEVSGKENEVHICFNNIDITKYILFLFLTGFEIIFFYQQTEHCNGDKGEKSTTYKRVICAVMTDDEVNVVLNPTLNILKEILNFHKLLFFKSHKIDKIVAL